MALDVQSIVGIGPLDNVLTLLQDFGFFRVVLPFLLIFAVFYGILIKTGIFGKDEHKEPTTIGKNASVIVAFVAAFFTIAYTPVVDALAILIPQASFLLVVALLIMMMVAFILPNFDEKENVKNIGRWAAVVVGVIVLIFVAIVGSSVGQNIPVLGTFAKLLAGGIDLTSEQISFFVGLAIVIGVPLLVVYMLTKPGREKAVTVTHEAH